MFEVDAEEIQYNTHNGVSLGACIYRPRGSGPFPAMVDSHGGAWIQGSYVNNDSLNRRIAAGGIVVMAIDFLLPPDGTYPASVADHNFAMRWLKKNAARYGTRPEWVGSMGTSAGGHLAAQAAIKPFDPRYAALPLEGGEAIDATASCMVAMWPVICPATRFRENLERDARNEDPFAGTAYAGGRVGGGLDQMKYWLTIEAMEDGSPMLSVERGDDIDMPDTLYVQAIHDAIHPRHCMDRFVAGYRKRGGKVEEVLLDGDPYDFLRNFPDHPEAKRGMKRIIEFIHECTTEKDRASISGRTTA